MSLANRLKWHRRGVILSGTSLAALGFCSLIGGCEKKEKVLEIQTPGFNLEVNKTRSPTGNKGVEIKSDGDKQIEIDATNKKTTSDN